MTFTRYLTFSAILMIAILYCHVSQSSAQVGNALACTNYTCRYGECEQLETNFTCHCPANVKGRNCDLRMQLGDSLCASSPCWSGGTCIDLGTDWTCQCPPGKSGKNCRTLSTAPCLTFNPCRNNAVCRSEANAQGFFCFCVGDWTGQFCETRLTQCSSTNPCYNGGTCVNGICECFSNFTGFRCETFVFNNRDKVIKILNKGWYIANIRVDYELYQGTTKFPVQQRGQIGLNHDFAFYIPHSVVLDGQIGVVVSADVVGGVRIFSVRAQSDPDCYHIWGASLFPCWTRVPCSNFKS